MYFKKSEYWLYHPNQIVFKVIKSFRKIIKDIYKYSHYHNNESTFSTDGTQGFDFC